MTGHGQGARTTGVDMGMDEGLKDRICGTLYGQAIGDALGLGAEFMSKSTVEAVYPGGLRRYDQIIRDYHRRRFRAGAWTDDTEQMLCILESLVDNDGVDVPDIARRFYRWMIDDGLGIGNTVLSVLRHPRFLTHPHFAAEAVWVAGGRQSAANGAVMRTSVLGVWDFDQPQEVVGHADQVCRITHWDPRCVGSCVVVCLLISALLRGETPDDTLYQGVVDGIFDFGPEVLEYLTMAWKEPLEALDLDHGLNEGEQENVGYTLKAMAAGVWAMTHAADFEEGLLRIVNEGGDADTNGAVAGALLGTRWGFRAIPRAWTDGLYWKDYLDRQIGRLIEAMES